MSIKPDYIDTPDQLTAFCKHLSDQTWLALDTEFLREKTYYPLFCLLQIATPERAACIDPIALPSLKPLFEILYDKSITKVFHSCRQDIEVLFQHAGNIPTPIFDTQIAAPYLGYTENISYAGLIKELLNVEISKTLTRTDWSKRPLTSDQINYAADDVIYLSQAYTLLHSKLQTLGRLAWLEKDFNELTQTSLYENAIDQAWRRIGSAQYLKDDELSIVQSLATWREATAKAENIPRGWLIKDDGLIDLAKRRPANPYEIKTIQSISERICKRYGETLCKLIHEAQDRAPEPVDLKKRPAKKTAEQEALFLTLQETIKIKASQHQINPNILANRKDIEQLMNQDPQSRLLQGWRKELIGDECLNLIKP